MPRGTLDTGRLAAAMARPGADTRVWLTYARIVETGFDAEVGIFADILTIPDGLEDTIMFGTQDVSDRGGLYCPVSPDQVVLVAYAGGDGNFGPMLISSTWSRSLRPPPEAVGTDGGTIDDVLWKVRTGRSLRFVSDGSEVRVSGVNSGRVVIETTGTGQVEIRSATTVAVDAPEVLLGRSPGGKVALVGSGVTVYLDVATVAAAVLAPSPTGTIPISGQVLDGAVDTEAG